MEQTLPVGNQAVTKAEQQESTHQKLSQKEAVYQYTIRALKGKTPAEGQSLRSLVNKEVKKEVRKMLFDGLKSGQVKLKSQKEDSALKKYCSGLINNWLNKDERFN